MNACGPFLVLLVSVTILGLAGTACAQDDILQGTEQVVQRFDLGHRGVLCFANEYRDIIEGESTARVYLTRTTGKARVLIERQGRLIEQVDHRDLDNDGLKEVAVLWRCLGQARFMTFEVYDVEVNGALARIFPVQGEEEYPHGEVALGDEVSKAPEGTTFALTHALCEISRRPPLLTKTRYFGPGVGGLVKLYERVGTPTTPNQQLNLAFEWYRLEQWDRGLRLARKTLDAVRTTGDSTLLADAYLAVSRGYRGLGKTELANTFERRAQLRDTTQRDAEF